MKRLAFLVFFSLFSLVTIAQDGFTTDGGTLMWRRVYNKSTDMETVARSLRACALFKDISISEEAVTAEFNSLSLDYKSLGYKRMSLPLYIVNNTYSGFVTIQVRDGRYRATVERIKTHSPSFGSEDLESFALKDGVLDTKFMGAPADIIGRALDSILSNLDKKTDNDEW